MKIKMLVGMAGAGFAWSVGQEVDVDDAEASRLINANYAIPVAEKVIEKRGKKAGD